MAWKHKKAPPVKQIRVRNIRPVDNIQPIALAEGIVPRNMAVIEAARVGELNAARVMRAAPPARLVEMQDMNMEVFEAEIAAQAVLMPNVRSKDETSKDLTAACKKFDCSVDEYKDAEAYAKRVGDKPMAFFDKHGAFQMNLDGVMPTKDAILIYADQWRKLATAVVDKKDFRSIYGEILGNNTTH